MLLFKASICSSTIAGKGLFADEFIPRGAVISPPDPNIVILSEEEYDRRSASGDSKVIRNGERLYGNFFYYLDQDQDHPSAFINHSDQPNVLLFMSFVFALRDINPGEEIMADYRLIVSIHDVNQNKLLPEKLVEAPLNPQTIVDENIRLLVEALKPTK